MKSITRIFVISLFIFSLNITAQQNSIKANGNVITSTRTVDNFDNIAVSGSFDVNLVKGKEGTITIKASENLMDVIVTEVENGVLTIKFKKGFNIKNYKTIDITVSYEAIEGIALSGSGNIHSNDVVATENLDLSLSGSGNFKLDVSSTNLNARISGSGNMNLSGTSDIFSSSISGSGKITSQSITPGTKFKKGIICKIVCSEQIKSVVVN